MLSFQRYTSLKKESPSGTSLTMKWRCQVLRTCIDVPLQQQHRFLHLRRFRAAPTSAEIEAGEFDLGSSPAP